MVSERERGQDIWYLAVAYVDFALLSQRKFLCDIDQSFGYPY